MNDLDVGQAPPATTRPRPEPTPVWVLDLLLADMGDVISRTLPRITAEEFNCWESRQAFVDQVVEAIRQE